MTTYYVDHAGSATDPYDTQAKAQTSIAALLAAKTLVAGDIVYACDNAGAGETIAAEINLNVSGTNAGGYIKLIGCNSSGVVDGTRYIISGGGNNINIVDLNGQDMWYFENIAVTNTGTTGTLHGFYSSAASAFSHVFNNCAAYTIDSSGFQFDNIGYTILFRCLAYSCYNGAEGYGGFNKYIFSCFRDNTNYGVYSNGINDLIFGCVSHNNTYGIGIQRASVAINCVTDGNSSDGILLESHSSLFGTLLLGNRITNQSGTGDSGLNCVSEPCIYGFNAFDTNKDHVANNTAAVNIPIPLEGTTTDSNDYNNEDGGGGGDTNQGYVDPTNHDFSTNYVSSSDPDLRRTTITIPWT